MRKLTVLKDGWRFLKAALPVETALQYREQGEQISLPHTWNAVDGQDGGNDYHRGLCWYVRELSAEELEKVTGGGEIRQMSESGEDVAKRVQMIREMLAAQKHDQAGSK